MVVSLLSHGGRASQVEEADTAQAVDPRVQTGNRDKRAKRAFNFVEEGTFIKQVYFFYLKKACFFFLYDSYNPTTVEWRIETGTGSRGGIRHIAAKH